jgi:hypothetical protein
MPFTRRWKSFGLHDEDLLALQFLIMLNPAGAPVVEGTGGLRKMRFAPKAWKTGKSGAMRVCYAYLEAYGTVLLIIVYSKDEKGDLVPEEKKEIRKLLRRIEGEFKSGVIR